MSTIAVRNALLAQLQADTVLNTEFGAGNIKSGVEQNFDIKVASKGIRVMLEASDQKLADLTGRKVDARYWYSVIAYFFEDDPEKTDDRASKYDEIIREAIEKDMTLGIGILDLKILRTIYMDNKKISNQHVVVFPVVCWARELLGNR